MFRLQYSPPRLPLSPKKHAARNTPPGVVEKARAQGRIGRQPLTAANDVHIVIAQYSLLVPGTGRAFLAGKKTKLATCRLSTFRGTQRSNGTYTRLQSNNNYTT